MKRGDPGGSSVLAAALTPAPETNNIGPGSSMKRTSLVFPGLCLVLFFLLARCHRASPGVALDPGDAPVGRPDQAQPLDEDAAEPPAFSPGRFAEILVADFTDEDPAPDIFLGEEIAAYLAWEIGPHFKGRVSRWAADAPLEDFRDAALLAGSARLSRQVRKALHRTDVPVDGPFRRAGRGLIEQIEYTLTITFLATAATTGEVIVTKEFERSQVYENIGKPPEVALYELLDLVKADLFPALFGPLGRTP